MCGFNYPLEKEQSNRDRSEDNWAYYEWKENLEECKYEDERKPSIYDGPPC